MDVPRKTGMRFWIGLVAIVALYCAFYLYFIYDLSREIPLKAVHFMKFLFIIVAYGLGILGLRGRAAGWMMRIWHLAYALGLGLLLGLGVFDWSVSRVPPGLRSIADNVLEFLISPILYVAIGLLARSLTAGDQAGQTAQRNGL